MNQGDRPDRDAYLEEIEDGLRSMIRWSRRHSSQLAHDLYQGLDLTALTILSALADSPQSRLTSLAEALKLDLSNASRQTSLLEAAKLVEKVTDPNDRRSTLLSLSPQGQKVLDQARSDSTEFMHRIYRDWKTSELQHFAAMISKTIEAIDAVDSPLTGDHS
ncbi:MarR family transcriptional regulator [Ferrimicrobium sp.]|uniref:MarR family winged helix-turn-helix transcriptional regulator n=1 Tax=Ferrimicrobium sp. TaxID=2926050 RepID=UPI002631CF75|nr:MarR family transcriptional regulator [Ferrimicrobium sp.]